MVSTPVDALKPSPLCLTEQEIEDIYDLIDQNLVPANFFELCAEARRKAIFGENYRVDKLGRPVESGLGSSENQTTQSVSAFRKWCVNEIDYEKTLARLERELVESDARRKAEAAAAPRRRAHDDPAQCVRSSREVRRGHQDGSAE
jgi:hypothetical protein